MLSKKTAAYFATRALFLKLASSVNLTNIAAQEFALQVGAAVKISIFLSLTSLAQVPVHI